MTRTIYAMLRLVDDCNPRELGFGAVRQILIDSDLGTAGLSIQSVRVARSKMATLNGRESREQYRDDKVLKITGAIECLEELVSHCHAHTFTVDEEAVLSCLENTREALKVLQDEKEKPPTRKPARHTVGASQEQ